MGSARILGAVERSPILSRMNAHKHELMELRANIIAFEQNLNGAGDQPMPENKGPPTLPPDGPRLEDYLGFCEAVTKECQQRLLEIKGRF